MPPAPPAPPELKRFASPELRRLRIEAGKKPKAFAEALDITPGYLSHVEAQRASPSKELLNAAAKQLGVDVADLTEWRADDSEVGAA